VLEIAKPATKGWETGGPFHFSRTGSPKLAERLLNRVASAEQVEIDLLPQRQPRTNHGLPSGDRSIPSSNASARSAKRILQAQACLLLAAIFMAGSSVAVTVALYDGALGEAAVAALSRSLLAALLLGSWAWSHRSPAQRSGRAFAAFARIHLAAPTDE